MYLHAVFRTKHWSSVFVVIVSSIFDQISARNKCLYHYTMSIVNVKVKYFEAQIYNCSDQEPWNIKLTSFYVNGKEIVVIMSKEDNANIICKRPILPHYFGRLIPAINLVETICEKKVLNSISENGKFIKFKCYILVENILIYLYINNYLI